MTFIPLIRTAILKLFFRPPILSVRRLHPESKTWVINTFMDFLRGPRIESAVTQSHLTALSIKKLILKHWEDILRFMATIKLRHCSASQLFKRLSSYAKDHPLYQAIKEFGRIIKSQFILTYYDDVGLRQRIEKQLNKVELANKFSKAVFFAQNQEFQNGTWEDQEVANACKVLIQNAIILWNYLYLSQRLSEIENVDERSAMIEDITSGSVITWRHVNLQGEYDFTRTAANDHQFDMKKIMALKVV